MDNATFSDSMDVLVFDQKGTPLLPKQFRKGGGELPISGSGQFSEANIVEALKSMKGEIWILDLRRESHGFINGLPISWYFSHNQSNVGLTTTQILEKEAGMLEALKRYNPVPVRDIDQKSQGNIVKTTVVEVVPQTIETESALSKRLGYHYLRLPVSDHRHPENEIVDAFIDFVKKHPQGVWLHFHCRGGKGRTTSFMTMYDMLVNGKKLSLNEIVERQKNVGGSNLFKITNDPDSLWKKDAQIKRKAFIEAFYDYASSPEGYPLVSWSEWSGRHNQ